MKSLYRIGTTLLPIIVFTVTTCGKLRFHIGREAIPVGPFSGENELRFLNYTRQVYTRLLTDSLRKLNTKHIQVRGSRWDICCI